MATTEQETIVYPTAPDADGFYFINEAEFKEGISTKEYENGNTVKRVILKKGKVAIVRELLAEDIFNARKLAGISDKTDEATAAEKIAYASIAMAVKIDDATIMPEAVGKMKLSDFQKIKAAHEALNF